MKLSLGFILIVNICINNMKLLRLFYEIVLLFEEEFFVLYDYVFLNIFYGLF